MDEKNMSVIKRNGSTVEVSFDKILKRSKRVKNQQMKMHFKLIENR